MQAVAINPLYIPPAQLARTQKTWELLAKEPLKIESTYLGEFIYAFGSELACLRLYRAFNGRCRMAYSMEQKSWYFRPLLIGESHF